MHRTRIHHLLLDLIVAATLTTVVGPVQPAAASGAQGSGPSGAYELFRQGERDFANRHDPDAASSSR